MGMTDQDCEKLIEQRGVLPARQYINQCTTFLYMSASAMILLLPGLIPFYGVVFLFGSLVVALIAMILLGLKPMVLRDEERGLDLDEVEVFGHYLRNHHLARAGWICIAALMGVSIAGFILMIVLLFTLVERGTDGQIFLAYLFAYWTITGLLFIASLIAYAFLNNRLFKMVNVRWGGVRFISLFVIFLGGVAAITILLLLIDGNDDLAPLVLIPVLITFFGFVGVYIWLVVDCFIAAYRFGRLGKYLRSKETIVKREQGIVKGVDINNPPAWLENLSPDQRELWMKNNGF